MKGRFFGFFSGFPNRRFPDEIAKVLKDEICDRRSLVYISAWPSDHESNDRDSVGMHGMFARCGIPFDSFCVIDSRTNAAKARELIRAASCIFLMGGNATEQMALIHEKGISDGIRESEAAILGVSAGSINMGKYSVDIWESLTPYEGLGLADITVKAHFSLNDKELVGKLQTVSMGHPVCAMRDESAIFVKNENISILGEVYMIDKGAIAPLSPEMIG